MVFRAQEQTHTNAEELERCLLQLDEQLEEAVLQATAAAARHPVAPGVREGFAEGLVSAHIPASSSNVACVVQKPPCAKTAKAASKPNCCTSRNLLPAWRSTAAADTLVRYWNDESYATFYNTSREERHTMMVSKGAAGLPPIASGKLEAAWRRSGDHFPVTSPRHKAALRVSQAVPADEDIGPSARPGVLSERKAAHFQEVFAKLSRGRQYIDRGQASEMFCELDLPLANLNEYLEEVADEAPANIVGKLTYATSLQLYKQALLPDIAKAAVSDALEEYVAEACGFSFALPVHELVEQTSPAKPATISSNVEIQRKTGTSKAHERFESLYRPLPASFGGSRSIFRKAGRFKVSPYSA
jgi:hypothetical protein